MSKEPLTMRILRPDKKHARIQKLNFKPTAIWYYEF